jgi:branched-chain amino acid transport system ATP-binding protein
MFTDGVTKKLATNWSRVVDADRLEAEEVRVHFGGVRAVDGVDLVVARDEILGLIGPNGAGKTTLVNVISGFERPTEGTVRLGGHDITGWPAHRRSRAGVVRTFQSVRLFTDLSVGENIEAAALGSGVGSREAEQRTRRLLEEFELDGGAGCGELPHGVERRVGIARALATAPAFVLLDEPAAGLNEAESSELIEMLREIKRRFECGICVIDHDMHLIMNLCDRVQVIDSGRPLAVGSPAEVRANKAVVAAYLGTS